MQPNEAFHLLDKIYEQLEVILETVDLAGIDENYFVGQLDNAMDLIKGCAELIKSPKVNQDD